MNLVDTIKGTIGPALVDRIAPMIGIPADRARAAIDSVVPGLLAAVAAKGSTPEGARDLSSMLDQTDDSLLDDPAGALTSRGSSLMESGGKLLQSFLGGNTVSGLSDVLGRFTGIGGGSLTSLLGMVAPFIFGSLGRVKRSMNLDASGLAGLLQDQKRNIASAMPQGLAGSLAGAPGLGSIADIARGIGGTAGREAVGVGASTPRETYRQPVADTSRRPYREEPRRTISPWTWALPLIAVLALGWLALSWLNRPQTPTRGTPASGTRPAQTQPAAQPAVRPQAVGQLPNEINSVVDSAVQTLEGVSDQATARTAATQLQDLGARLDTLRGSFTNLPQGEQQTVGTTVTNSLNRVRDAADRALAIPGTRETLGPAVDALVEKLRAFGGR